MDIQTRYLLPTLAALLAVCLLPARAHTQGVIIEPPPPIAWIEGVAVDEHIVDAKIDGAVAEVTVKQVFRNESRSLAEGTFLFPLPEDAAVSDFQMTVNGQVIEGQLMDSELARRIYEETVREIRDPALLEYAGRGLFRTSVFPIPPGETRTLQLRYLVVLESENGLYRFTYPLRVPGASRPAQRTELEIDLSSDEGLRAVYSPTHDVLLVREDDNRAVVRYESEGEVLDADFELYYGVDDDTVGLNLISHKPAGEDGYFLLLASPSIEVTSEDIASRDVVFVVDVSGSMEGPKLKQAKEAVRYVVEHLNPNDRFNLVAFSTGVRLWNERLMDATEENVADAQVWIDRLDASGSTDINRALLESLAQFDTGEDSDTATGYLLFMTDGLPTQGETEAPKIIRNALSNQPDDVTIRLFSFGVGFDVDTDLLDVVSRQLGGRSSYVRPDEQIDEAVSQFYATIQTPVLTNVELDFGGDPVVSEVFPYPIPDLFAGEQLVVTGRYRNGGELAIVLQGKVDGDVVRTVYTERRLVNAGGEPFVARLWATRKIGVLMDQIRRSGPEPELVDAIADLSMRYGIVTPYTSYLVEEPEAYPPAQVRQDGGRDVPPMDFSSRARESVAAEAEEAAEAPASGEAAVAASLARAQLQSATAVDEHQAVKYAGGRAFVAQRSVALPNGRQATLWVDTAYDLEMDVETVPFGSERYFELAADDSYAEILALSPEILFSVDDVRAIRVTSIADADDTEYATDTQAGGAALDSENHNGDESAWEQFMEWLSGQLVR